MKYKDVTMFLLIIASAVFWGWLLRFLKVSGKPPTWSDLLPDILMYIFCYLSGYLIGVLCLHYLTKDLNFYLTYISSIIATAILGAFFYTVYQIIRSINRDWWFISEHRKELYGSHLAPGIEFFIFDAILFLVFNFALISFVFLGKLIKDSFTSRRN